jgi:general secretion pathway protein D
MFAALLSCLFFLVPLQARQPGPRPMGPGPRPGLGAPTDEEGRLSNLEKQLDALQKSIDELRKEIKAKPPSDKPDMRIFTLKHVEATDVAKTIQAVFGDASKAIRIVADPQTNSILVSAPDQDVEIIKNLISQLDIAVAPKKAADNAPVKPDVRIFALKNAPAAEMAATFKAVFGSTDKTLRIVADERTNSLIVYGPADVLTTMEAVLGRLDVPAENAATKVEIKVFLLKKLDAAATAKVLREIFPAEQYLTLRLSVSEQTNSVVAAGSAADLMAIEALIVRLEGTAKDKKPEKVSEAR